MQLKALCAVVAAAFALTACNKSETQAEVQHDVAKAEAQADQAHDANETADEGQSKIRIAQAEALHKVAVEKCDALTGGAQKECKDDADELLEEAKDRAKDNR